MRKPLPPLLLLLIASIFLVTQLVSCKKDLDFSKIKNITWTPDFAVPLVHDSITFESALIETGTEKNFYIDESGDISILYYFHNDAFGITVDDLLDLPPYTGSYNHQVTPMEEQILGSGDYAIPPVTITVDLAENITGVRIDKLLIKEGHILVQSNNSFYNDGYLELKFLNATKSGVPFSATIGPFEPGPRVDTIDVSNVLFDLTANPNKVFIEVDGLLKQSNQPVAGDIMASDFTLDISKIGWFQGYLGYRSFTPPEEFVKITVFNNIYNYGEIWFEDPKVSMTLYNSIGVPARVTVEKLEAVNTHSQTRLDIADRLGPNAVIPIPSPDLGTGLPSVTQIVYTNSNTGNSMNELFNVKPDQVFYKIKTEINPGSPQVNFFSDTSSFYADLFVQLPLYGHFTNIIVQDTFKFDLNKQQDIEQIEFRTNIVNGLPLKARLQVYFTDQDYNKIDSLMGSDQVVISEAPVDPSTHLPIPGIYGERDTSFFLDRTRMDRLSGAEHMLVRAALNSSDNGTVNVKIRARQMLRLDFSARVKLRKELNP